MSRIILIVDIPDSLSCVQYQDICLFHRHLNVCAGNLVCVAHRNSRQATFLFDDWSMLFFISVILARVSFFEEVRTELSQFLVLEQRLQFQ